MLSLGLDIGYSSIKLALIDSDNRILYHAYKLHRGNIRETLGSAIKDLLRHPEAGKIRRGAVTGSGGRGLSEESDITFVNEATAIVEGALFVDHDHMRSIRLGLLAGDVIRTAPPKNRNGYLQQLLELLDNEELEIGHLEKTARKIRGELQSMANPKKILAAGEPYLLYNDYLNNFSFRDLEKNGYRVVYSPLSECMWLT